MDTLMNSGMPLAAAGYSVMYMLLGGGAFGALVIFVIAKLLGK
ncbi:MAG: hypothetical protein NT069_25350 [Planctomycetota bacterium]|nr:hypothetical protein [Planctomycetota bacterium]